MSNKRLNKVFEFFASFGIVWLFIGVFMGLFSISNSFISPPILKKILPSIIYDNMNGGEMGLLVFVLFSVSIIISFVLVYIFSFRYEKTRRELQSLIEKSNKDFGEITKEGIDFVKKAKDVQQIFNDIKLEFDDASLKLSEQIDDNLYTYKRLKRDLLDSEIVFVYGSLHYLKNDESNVFLHEALLKNYWKTDSSKYFVLITTKVKDSIDNLFEFINKIEEGINGYNISANEFENFFIGFRDVDPKIASPIQMVAFLNKIDTTKYTFKDNYTPVSIKDIMFSMDSSLNLKRKENGNDYKPTAKSCIGHTLVFSNDLINQEDVKLEKKIIGFKIPIKAGNNYEVLKEFDNLREDVDYYKLSDIIKCCIHCKSFNKVDCVGRFEQLIINNFNCENKDK
jgi:uncharacterized membrane protein